MWEAIAKLLTETIPVEVRTRIVACMAFVGLMIWIAWSTGAFPFFEGFARGREINSITNEFRTYQAEQDKNAILALRQTECSLPKGQSKTIYTDTINTRMAEYFKITGQGFQLPACDDF